MKKLLIIGAGGYISAIVIPTLKEHFKGIEITVLSKRPSNTLTVAARNNVNAIESLDDIKKYDLYFLAIPPVDYEYFLKLIPKDKPLWIEKPLSEASEEHLMQIENLLQKFTSNIYVGFNKREILNEVALPNSNTSGKLSMKVYYEESMNKNLWKQYMLKGGVYFADGIHMIDLALYILGEDSSIELVVKTDDLWKFEVISTKGKLIVEIGNHALDLIDINGYQNSDFVKYENSLKFFNLSFAKFIDGKSNYKVSLVNSRKIIKEINNANS
jgi:predicted dehydrogenase